MNQRVYGVVGISSIMANWNADFTGRPKTISTGDIFGSDKALKYPIKKMWMQQGEKVLYIKSYKIDNKGKDDGKLKPLSLKERYEFLFGVPLDKKDSSKVVIKNLFSAVDVMNFGATFAEEKQNISITGAVQVGQGFNKDEETSVEIQDILSPFRNAKNEEADASSLGTKVMVDEAHYFYPFAVNPDNYLEYESILEGFEGYTREAYEKFKEGCLIGTTAFHTNSKSGCENEFALFVTCNPESKVYLPNLDRYISFKRGEEKNIIDLTKLGDLLTGYQKDIEMVEVYYNPYTTDLCTEGLKANIQPLF
ncbi:MAG: type I CRISPR-associated protein Cas7 [Tissierellia bacterium]|nr:type I CRISPR-associated protein Cas7 [Tissierellia bacterium]